MHLALFLKGNSIAIRGNAPDTTCGAAYNFAYEVQGGTGPYTYTVADGVLPQGLELDPETGVISGTIVCPVTTVFTTPLYPVEVVDALNSTATAVSGLTYQQIVEAVDVSFGVLSGQLRALLQQYNMQTEAIDTAFSISSGELRTLLKQYSYPTEALDTAMSITSGALAAILINYVNWPTEAIDVTFGPTGGSLT